MRNKVYWGLGILIILLIGAFVLVMVNKNAQIKQLEAEAKKAQDKANQIKEQDALKNNPPVAREGYKMVPHGDHWHEVPIDAPDTWQGESHGEGVTEDDIPLFQPSPTQTNHSPLTYHAELLKTNPVKALRLQAEERGHWSAKWIPPFPSDDHEAAAIARDLYLITYYESIGDTTNPVCLNALRNTEKRLSADSKKRVEWLERRDAISSEDVFANTEEYQQLKWEGARMNDLARVKWSRVTEGLISDPARFASKTLLTKPE